MDINPGDILLTRNSEEVGNDSPGWWNHCVMYVGLINGEKSTVEAMSEPWGDGVDQVPFNVIWDRYPIINFYRLIGNNQRAAVRDVISRIGLPYNRISSIWRRWRRIQKTHGENCVSLVRKGAGKALGRDPKWTIPDDVADSKYTYVVFKKRRHYDLPM